MGQLDKRNHTNATMPKLRLMIITFDLAIGGMQRVVVNICANINREMFDVSVLCLRPGGAFVVDIESMGIKVFHLPQKKENRTDYLAFLKIAKILRRERTDIIHTHNSDAFIEGTMAALLSGVRTIVHTDHARDFPDTRRYMFAEWVASHFAYKVVGVSDHTCQNLIEYEKISPQKVMTIVNGVNCDEYNLEIDKAEKRKELGLPPRGPIIGLGVRLARQKGISFLLKAMPELIKLFPDITLVIAGEGPIGDELKQESEALGVDKNVRFIGPRLNMPEILKLLDIYVLPSLWEGLPMVLLEAMAAGCPLIATDVGGVSTIIKRGQNGSLVKSCDTGELSSEIAKLLADSELRIQYSRNGVARVREEFSADAMTRKYERLYLRSL